MVAVPIFPGYNHFAPIDTHDKVRDFTARILTRFFEIKDLIDTNQDTRNLIEAWIDANKDIETTAGANRFKDHSASNSCGIDARKVAQNKAFYQWFNRNPDNGFQVDKIQRLDQPNW